MENQTYLKPPTKQPWSQHAAQYKKRFLGSTNFKQHKAMLKKEQQLESKHMETNTMYLNSNIYI